MKRIVASLAALVMGLVLVTSPVIGRSEKVTICHAAGLAGTTKFVTLTIGYNAVYGPAGHFYENGTPRAGHEEDYLGPCQTQNPSPSATTLPTPTPLPSSTPTPTPVASVEPTPTPSSGASTPPTPSNTPSPTPRPTPTVPTVNPTPTPVTVVPRLTLPPTDTE